MNDDNLSHSSPHERSAATFPDGLTERRASQLSKIFNVLKNI